MNTIHIVGKMTTEPEMGYSPKGDPCANFVLVAGRTHTKAFRDNRADLYYCHLWGKAASIAKQTLHRGCKLYIVGTLKPGVYMDRAGRLRLNLEVDVNMFERMYVDAETDEGRMIVSSDDYERDLYYVPEEIAGWTEGGEDRR